MSALTSTTALETDGDDAGVARHAIAPRPPTLPPGPAAPMFRPAPMSVPTPRVDALEETLAALEEALADGSTAFAFLDRSLRYRRVNEHMARMHGLPAAAHLGRSVPEVIGAENWDAVAGAIRAALAGQAARDLPLSGRFAGDEPGRTRYAAASYFPVRTAGTVAGVAVVVRDITGRVEAERERIAAAERQRQFMRDVLASVTGGRLRLCHSPDELPERLAGVGPPATITRHGGIKDLRQHAEAAARRMNFGDENWFDLETAIGEAAMNALVHAGGGVGTVFAGGSSRDGGPRLQIWVEDTGKGIAFEHLPRATLEKGYTTADTLGHGFKMILKTADRVHLLTGPAGTTVVLEKFRDTPSTPSAADEW